MIDDILRSDAGGRALARFTRDLTADARAGRLEPVRCREGEVTRAIDILLRHGKNNPTLVGPAGVGKTAIAEGLAQRIAVGNVPVSLRDVRLLSLDHVGLLAGTTYRGDYEERIRSLIAETMAAGNIILFIDELHNLIGQGQGRDAAMDAANMLKPSLVRGDFRVIGATTGDEYDRWIANDPALERRFQKIIVHELGEADALEILIARKERLERHHNVLIADESLRAAIALTDRYVTDRLRPDKAIDALDEACAHMQAVTTYSPTTEALIRERLRMARRAAAAQLESETRAPYSQPDGFSALERFGAELEAMFVGPQLGTTRAAGHAEAQGQASSAAPTAAARSVAAVEAELGRRLMEEGIVVRGHDIARVVGLMAGTVVTWETAETAEAAESAEVAKTVGIGETGEGERMMYWKRILLVLGALGVAGCRERPRVAGPYGDKVAQDVPMIEKALGRKFKTPPRLELRSHDQVRDFLLERLKEPDAQHEVAGQEFTYKLLGLIPDTLDLKKFTVALLTEQVIGYYDPKTKVLYVVEGAQDTYAGITIMHELVHALQDQYVNLDSIEHASGDDDRESAVQAVVEGQAMYEQSILMAGGPDNIAIDLPGGWDEMRQSIRDQAETQPIFASAPKVIQESLLFPYINGMEFIRRYAHERPGTSPLDNLPMSSKQVMHDSAYFGKVPDVPIAVTLPAVPETVYQNDLGEFGTRLFFYQHLANLDQSANAALGWKGDRYVAFHASGGPAIAWVTVWDSPVSAATFTSAMGDVIRRRYGVEKPVVGADGTRRYNGDTRTVVISTREISGHTTVLYVDVPAGTSTDVLDLARVTLGSPR